MFQSPSFRVMSRIERSNENCKISYSSKMTKNGKRVDGSDEIYSRAERKGATKTTNLTKVTKYRCRDENDEKWQEGRRKWRNLFSS